VRRPELRGRLQHPPAHHRLRSHRHRRGQGRQGRRALPRVHRGGPGRGPEGRVVDRAHRSDRRPGPDRQRRELLRLVDDGFAAVVRRGRLSRSGDRVLRRLPGAGQSQRAVHPAVLLRGLARRADGLRLPFIDRHDAGDPEGRDRQLGGPQSYAAFAVPLGAKAEMDGCAAIYPAIAAVVVAPFFGVDLSLIQYLLIIFVAVIGSAATAGTTGATVMLTLTLSTLGLPLEGVGLLLAIEPIVDMGRTALNVSGQALIPAIVAKRHDIL